MNPWDLPTAVAFIVLMIFCCVGVVFEIKNIRMITAKERKKFEVYEEILLRLRRGETL